MSVELLWSVHFDRVCALNIHCMITLKYAKLADIVTVQQCGKIILANLELNWCEHVVHGREE